MLIDTDTKQQKAAPQHLLRAGHRRRYAAGEVRRTLEGGVSCF